MKSIGRIAYEAYCKYSSGKSLVSGAQLPTWDDQAESIRGAWEAAAAAVISAGVAEAKEAERSFDKPDFCDI